MQAVGLQAPAIVFLAFLPCCSSRAYYYLNRADPDCGTTFAWVPGPWAPPGWLGGWASVVADIVVMANLAQIAGKYTFLLFNADGLAEDVFWVTFLGCVFIARPDLGLLRRHRGPRPGPSTSCSGPRSSP